MGTHSLADRILPILNGRDFPSCLIGLQVLPAVHGLPEIFELPVETMKLFLALATGGIISRSVIPRSFICSLNNSFWATCSRSDTCSPSSSTRSSSAGSVLQQFKNCRYS